MEIIRRILEQRSYKVVAAAAVVALSAGGFAGVQAISAAYDSTSTSYSEAAAECSAQQLNATSAVADLTKQIVLAETLEEQGSDTEIQDLDDTRAEREALEIAASKLADDHAALIADPSVLPWEIAATADEVHRLCDDLNPLIANAIDATAELSDYTETAAVSLGYAPDTELDDVVSDSEAADELPKDNADGQTSAATPRTPAASTSEKAPAASTPKAPATTAPTPAKPSTPAGPATYRVHVGQTAVSSNQVAMQAAVDAGGQVAISFASLGMTFVTAHNYNDDTALKLKEGDLVTFSGVMSGTYRVTTSMDVKTGSSAAPAKAVGTQIVMQTCYWNSDLTRIVGLTPA